MLSSFIVPFFFISGARTTTEKTNALNHSLKLRMFCQMITRNLYCKR